MTNRTDGGANGATGDPPPWVCARSGVARTKEQVSPPPGHAWLDSEWKGGPWEYAPGFTSPKWSTSEAVAVAPVRRRKWVRTQAASRGSKPLRDRVKQRVGLLQRLESERRKAGVQKGEPARDGAPEWMEGRLEVLHELELSLSAASQPFERFPVYADKGSTLKVATLKGMVRAVRSEEAAADGLPVELIDLLSPSRYTVRLYLLKAASLQPADRSGTSDPYLRVSLGGKTQGDRSQHVQKVNDVEFYSVFEVGHGGSKPPQTDPRAKGAADTRARLPSAHSSRRGCLAPRSWRWP